MPSRKLRASISDPYVPLIVETLAQYPKLSAIRVYVMAKERGYLGGPDHFRRIVALHRPRPVAEWAVCTRIGWRYGTAEGRTVPPCRSSIPSRDRDRRICEGKANAPGPKPGGAWFCEATHRVRLARFLP